MNGAIGAVLGTVAFDLFRVRRAVSLANLERAFPEAAPGELVAIARRSYRQFGRTVAEFAAFEKLRPERILRLVEFEGLEHFDRALEAGRGAVLFTGHFGSWELLGAAIAARGYPIDFLVGRQSNPWVDALMNRLRRIQGIGIIEREMALRKVLRSLRRNRFVALLADQDARRSGVFVDFFGTPASTPRGPALFALHQGCPVIPGFIIREGSRHRAVIGPPLWPRDDLQREEAIRDLTQRLASRLEDVVRRHPDHYFWPHRRWKTRPPEPAA
jgi:KDO2-lipid IV(A) lauroyltransferase